jgi:hypothetical protein
MPWCSKGEAVAAQAPEVTITDSRGLDAGTELVGSLKTTVRMALSGMPVPGARDAGVSGFANETSARKGYHHSSVLDQHPKLIS